MLRNLFLWDTKIITSRPIVMSHLVNQTFWIGLMVIELVLVDEVG